MRWSSLWTTLPPRARRNRFALVAADGRKEYRGQADRRSTFLSSKPAADRRAHRAANLSATAHSPHIELEDRKVAMADALRVRHATLTVRERRSGSIRHR